MTRVFLSHSSADKRVVRKFADRLRSDGIAVWMDESDLRAGEVLADAIAKAILEADHILVFASRAADSSFWVKREIQLAVHREIDERRDLIIPIKLDEVDLPPFVAPKLYIKAFPAHRRLSAYRELLSAVHRSGSNTGTELVRRLLRSVVVGYTLGRSSRSQVRVTREMSYFPVNLLPIPQDIRPGFNYSASERSLYDPPTVAIYRSGEAEPAWSTTPSLEFNKNAGTYDRVVKPRTPGHKTLLTLPSYGRRPHSPIRVHTIETFRRPLSGEDVFVSHYPIEGLTVAVRTEPGLLLDFRFGDNPDLHEVPAADHRRWTLSAPLPYRQGLQLRWFPSAA